jgi:hypothetical protein
MPYLGSLKNSCNPALFVSNRNGQSRDEEEEEKRQGCRIFINAAI